jgi:PPOX class probable F420-dependent enzyme
VPALDEQTCRRLVAEAGVGRLATVTAAGRPHVVPCCFALVGSTICSVVDAKPKSTTALRRLDNVRANPAAALLVDHYEDDWSRLWWVRVDGAARVVEYVDEYELAIDALVAKYRQYREDRPTGPLLALSTDRWTGWAATPVGEAGRS